VGYAPPRVKIADKYRMAPPVPPPQKRYYPLVGNGNEERDEVEECMDQLAMVERRRAMADVVKEAKTSQHALHRYSNLFAQAGQGFSACTESDVGFALAFAHYMLPGESRVEDLGIVMEAAQAIHAMSAILPGRMDPTVALGYLIEDYRRRQCIDVNAIAQNILQQQQQQQQPSSYPLYPMHGGGGGYL